VRSVFPRILSVPPCWPGLRGACNAAEKPRALGIYSRPDHTAANEIDPMDNAPANRKRPRGIYLLPNLFTTAALFAGFYAVLAATQDRFEAAALAIFAAQLLDGIDGRVARITQTQSDFGAEYDSLSDMVAFGVAPALVAYHWALGGLGKVGWLAAFVFTAAAALRLARFNTQVRIADKRYFQGLASPAAAAIIASGVWIGADTGIAGADVAWIAALLTAGAGLLMVSNFRYLSFKQLNLQGRVPFLLAVAVMLGFAVIFINPPLILFLMATTYAVSGPVWTLLRLRKSRARHRRERR
jgi:CDP-diacylglycerol--serine O-phosphatidyltransferase